MAGDSNVLVYLMEYTWKMEQMFGEEMTALNGSLTIDSGSLEREDVEEQGKNYYFYYFEVSQQSFNTFTNEICQTMIFVNE